MMTRSSAIALSAGLLAAALLASCRSKPVSPLPEGPQEVAGVLKAAPLSVKGRGTHVVLVGGVETYAAESSLVSLSEFEGEEVLLQGTFSFNIDPDDLPVLTVTDVVSKAQAMREVSSKNLKLRLEVPDSWRTAESSGLPAEALPAGHSLGDGWAKAGTGGTLRFTGSGTASIVLTVVRSPLTALPAGSPVLVDGLRGVRVIPGGSSDQIVYVQRGAEIVQFTFTPSGLDPLTAPALFLKILRTVRFTGLPQRSSAGSGTGTLKGQPCGGVAGILCPEGEYCAITNAVENIGVCVKSR